MTMQTKIDTDDATMLVQMQHKQLEMLKELDRV